jgi:Tfp pilus assembly protein PilO
MSMTRKWSLLTAVLVVGILVASWFLLVSPKRGDAAALTSQRQQQDATNIELQQHIKMLQAQELDLPAQRAKLAEIRREIPDNPALPSMVRSISKIARQTGVDLIELSPAEPTAYVDPALAAAALVPAPVATSTDGSATTGTTPTDTTTTAPPAGTTPTTGTTGTTGLAGTTPTGTTGADLPVLYQAPVKITAEGSFFQLEQFLNRLEKLQRAFLVTGFTVDAAQSDFAATAPPGTLELTLDTRMFISAPSTAPAVAVLPTAVPSPTTATP